MPARVFFRRTCCLGGYAAGAAPRRVPIPDGRRRARRTCHTVAAWPGGSKPHAGDDEASVVITGDQSLVDCAMAVDLRRNLTGIGLLYSTCRIRWQAVGHRTLRAVPIR